MKRWIARLLVIYGTSLSVMFAVALIPDYAALIESVEQRDKQTELRHRINVFAQGTWFLLSNLIAISGIAITDRQPEP